MNLNNLCLRRDRNETKEVGIERCAIDVRVDA